MAAVFYPSAAIAPRSVTGQERVHAHTLGHGAAGHAISLCSDDERPLVRDIQKVTRQTIPAEDRRMIYQKGNYLWHADSSFRPAGSLCSLLSARIVPPEGGNTEFASMTAAYDALPDDAKHKLEGLVAEHSLVYSRETVTQNALTPEMKAELPGAWQTMLRTHPVTGRKAVYAGAHASHVIGWPMEEGRAFIRWLNDFATQPRFCFSHAWRAGDLVIWDNRFTLHRATAYDTVRHKRLMQRTTVKGEALTAAQPERYELAAA